MGKCSPAESELIFARSGFEEGGGGMCVRGESVEVKREV